MPCIDGFVIPVATTNRNRCIDHAKRMDKFMLENGARRMSRHGVMTFPMA